jgi:hypothetical protein
VADVIERAIKQAVTGRQGRAEVPAAVQPRVVRVLIASPPVINSLAATGNRAPSSISKNIKELFGYPTDYFQHRNFWRSERTR